MINHNNRPVLAIPLAALSASGVIPLLVAEKKMKILAASIIQEAAIAADAVNSLAYRFKVNNTLVGTSVSNAGGVTARTKQALGLGADGYITLEKGDYLALDVVETGTYAVGAAAALSLDVEVVGN